MFFHLRFSAQSKSIMKIFKFSTWNYITILLLSDLNMCTTWCNIFVNYMFVFINDTFIIIIILRWHLEVRVPSFVYACLEKYKEFCESSKSSKTKCIQHCNNYREGSFTFLQCWPTKGLLKSMLSVCLSLWRRPVSSAFFQENSFLLKFAQIGS